MRSLLITLLVLSFSSPLFASPTKHWGFESYASFRGGKSEGVLLPNTGGLLPGLRATKAKSKASLPGLFYTMVKVGNTVYQGSGDPAAIWTLRGNTLNKIAQFDTDLVVTKLIKGPGNSLIAATLPNGNIYKVTTTGKASLIVKLGANHVWDIVLKGTTLYAVTGPEATLYMVDINQKKATKIWSIKEKHLLSVALDAQNNLLIGTSPEARLYKVNPATKKGVLLYDFPGNELRNILVSGDKVYVAANNLTYRASTSYATRRYPSGQRKGHKGVSILTAKPKKSFGRRSVIRGSGTIFMLDKRGIAESMLSIASGYVTKIAVEGQFLYGADGQSGRIYRMSTQDFSGSIVMQSDERQILDFILEKEKSGYVATGDGAALYTLSRTQGKPVKYESVALDAQRAAQFGNLFLDVQDGAVTIETRSGITPKPDDTLWNPWRPVRGLRMLPSGIRQGKVASKSARYLQFRVIWPNGSKATVKELQIFFVPENLRPRVVLVTATGTGTSGSHGSTPSIDKTIPARLSVRSGDIRISWSVLNLDQDSLVYRVWAKKAGDKLWRRLSPRTPISATSYTWKAGFEPDGVYLIKVEASDSPSNAPGKALTSYKISQPIVVDNRAPLLTGLNVRRGVVRFSVADNFSRITGAAYRVGAGKWHMVLPSDGMFDSNREKFSFTLPSKLKPGAHLIQVRVMDASGNIGTFSQEFTK